MAEYTKARQEFEEEMISIGGTQRPGAGQARTAPRSRLLTPKRPPVKRKLKTSLAPEVKKHKRPRKRSRKPTLRHVCSPTHPLVLPAGPGVIIREGGNQAASRRNPRLDALFSPSKEKTVEKRSKSEEIAHVIKMSQCEARMCGPSSSSTVIEGQSSSLAVETRASGGVAEP